MTAKYADRVKETTTTTGTGTYNLAGASTGFQTFLNSTNIGTGDQVHYTCENGTDWEVGIGTITAGSPDTLSRTTILDSSTGGSAISWAAGTKNIFATVPAKFLQGVAQFNWTDAQFTIGSHTDSSGSGQEIEIRGGSGTSSNGGNAGLFGGAATSGNNDGGDVHVEAGVGFGTGVYGDVTIGGENIDFQTIKAIKLNGSAGTAGQVLTSQGSSSQPTWTTPSGGSGSDPIPSTFLLMGA